MGGEKLKIDPCPLEVTLRWAVNAPVLAGLDRGCGRKVEGVVDWANGTRHEVVPWVYMVWIRSTESTCQLKEINVFMIDSRYDFST